MKEFVLKFQDFNAINPSGKKASQLGKGKEGRKLRSNKRGLQGSDSNPRTMGL